MKTLRQTPSDSEATAVFYQLMHSLKGKLIAVLFRCHAELKKMLKIVGEIGGDISAEMPDALIEELGSLIQARAEAEADH